MKIIEPQVVPLNLPDKEVLYQVLETAGRTCYQSERAERDTPAKFLQRTISRGHMAVMEHMTISLLFICDRGVSHEIVRHRMASYCQESTRYCNYSKGKFGSELTFIKPCFWEENSLSYKIWESCCEDSERAYMDMLNAGSSPQEARSILPNSLKTQIVVTMNIREWRHFLSLRYFGIAGTPHPQMRQVAKMAWDILYSNYPEIFEDLQENIK